MRALDQNRSRAQNVSSTTSSSRVFGEPCEKRPQLTLAAMRSGVAPFVLAMAHPIVTEAHGQKIPSAIMVARLDVGFLAFFEAPGVVGSSMIPLLDTR